MAAAPGDASPLRTAIEGSPLRAVIEVVVRALVDQPDAVKSRLAARGERGDGVVDDILACDAERRAVLDVLHSERFVDQAPASVYATLLDEGRYLASIWA